MNVLLYTCRLECNLILIYTNIAWLVLFECFLCVSIVCYMLYFVSIYYLYISNNYYMDKLPMYILHGYKFILNITSTMKYIVQFVPCHFVIYFVSCM